MGIRESLNKNPSLVIKSTVGVLILAVGLAGYHYWSGRHSTSSAKEFYSDDDGSTWFLDDATNKPPYIDKNGKEAVLAKVFVTGGGQKFIGYLEKAGPDGPKADVAPARHGARAIPADAVAATGPLFKKPHDAKWVTATDPDYKQVIQVRAPDGKDDYMPVDPAE